MSLSANRRKKKENSRSRFRGCRLFSKNYKGDVVCYIEPMLKRGRLWYVILNRSDPCFVKHYCGWWGLPSQQRGSVSLRGAAEGFLVYFTFTGMAK